LAAKYGFNMASQLTQTKSESIYVYIFFGFLYSFFRTVGVEWQYNHVAEGGEELTYYK